jgi:FKBP-type peptidyl-prolyl cis-trans isomerase FkpA
MTRPITFVGVMILIVAFGGIPATAGQFAETAGGLQYKDLKVGAGRPAADGDTAKIHFIGWVDESGRPGREIYNSRKEGKPVSFVIGTDKVMQGWNEGIVGMRSGGNRLLRIPPELGYGQKAVDDLVPPNAHLIFVIELLELE